MKNISKEKIKEFESKFMNKKNNTVIMNAISNAGIDTVSKVFNDSYKTKMTFSKEIKTKKVTYQKKTGRCWLFAGTNLLRHNVEKKYNIENFELSQSYLMFWDKFEKANYFLECIIDSIDLKTNSREVSHLLSHIVEDGGQWDMFYNLVKKYGVVPKDVMKESYHSSDSAKMNKLIILKLRKDAKELRKNYKENNNIEKLREIKINMLEEIYSMLCKILSKPIEKFDFEYTDSDDNYHIVENLTPQSFYENIVDLDLDNYVSIINAPTSDKPFNKSYTVKYLGNVIEGREIRYLNVDIDTMKTLTKKQILDDEPVWFGCDVSQMSDRKEGVMSMGAYDYDSLFNTDFKMSKAERLDYQESVLNHAMLFTGLNMQPDGSINRWKVENSWGDERGKDGYFMMTDEWFEEYMYEVVINKKHLDKEQINNYESEPIVLDPWDPMGSLA